jgi:peptidoglycan/xylan/chitin deacetylase (PgdA/CDA1 family)
MIPLQVVARALRRSRDLAVMFRDDDVDEWNGNLGRLLDLFARYGVPLNLAVIPAALRPACAERLIAAQDRVGPEQLELAQHGYTHTNHGAPYTYAEFGAMRSRDEQRSDMERGRAVLSDLLDGRVSRVFVPPFNHYDATTLLCLGELGYQVLSKGADHPYRRNEYPFAEVSTNLDLVARYLPQPPYVQLKSRQDVFYECSHLADTVRYVGVLVHHGMLTLDAFEVLEDLLVVVTGEGTPCATLTALARRARRHWP